MGEPGFREQRTTEIAIANATSRDLELVARNERLLDFDERTRRENKRRFPARLADKGDWRHYRIYYVELVLARESLAKEYRFEGLIQMADEQPEAETKPAEPELRGVGGPVRQRQGPVAGQADQSASHRPRLS
jgi:hypothetical protein